jgi:stage II sporulation protein AA (anti-sigma F factor antagonist)
MSEIKLEMKDIDDCPNGKVISFIGTLDTTNIASISDEIWSIIDSGFYKLVFDLSQLKYINSTVMGDMVAHKRRCKNKGGTICVAGADKDITEICETIGLPKLFGFYKTVDEAIEKEIKK